MREWYRELLAKMVNIDSGTGDDKGISEVAAIAGHELKAMGFDFQTLAGQDGSKHYYASRGKGERILLLAHLDTVFPKGTAAKRAFKIEGDKAYGPGVSDCKSGVVTIIGALERLKQIRWPDYEIVCLFNSDEEIGSPGSRAIIEKLGQAAKAVVVVEPAEGETLTVARKGIGRFKMQVFGKAAHSGSNYQEGRNAILELAHKIIAIHGLTGTLPGVTLNVGVISGGVRSNIVPDYAEAEIDLRLASLGQDKPIIELLQQITGRYHVPGCSAKLNGGITRPPMPLTEANMKIFLAFQQAGTELGINLDTLESGGGSDANFTAALGIPTVDGAGPVGGGHHSEEEYMIVSSLEQRIELLARFLSNFRI